VLYDIFGRELSRLLQIFSAVFTPFHCLLFEEKIRENFSLVWDAGENEREWSIRR